MASHFARSPCRFAHEQARRNSILANSTNRHQHINVRVLPLHNSTNEPCACLRITVLCRSMKDRINLMLDAKVIEEVKVRAIREHRSVSEIVEELLRDYLKQKQKH